jgi:PAS domain S-box-containing protein/putative nucleotidyltransferase with HDIG domain
MTITGARILIVEDEAIVAMDIQNTLESLGYVVPSIVFSGEEAIKKAAETQPDLVLMDIVLKGHVNGVEAAEEIRDRFDIPVVYLTAYADEKTFQRAKIAEPYGYIIKPFDERELHITIETSLYKHKMERKLKENERWLATTLKSIGDAVIATDARGCISFMNPVAEALTGWRQEGAIGRDLKDIFNIINEQTREAAENPVTKVLREGVVVGLANHSILIAKDGSEIPIDDSGAPIRDDRGNIAGVVVVFHDITERKQREREWETITTITTALRTAQTRTDMLPVILNQVLDLLKAEGAALAMRDPTTGETLIEMGRGGWANWTGLRLLPGEGVSGQVIVTSQPYVSSDALSDPLFARPDLIGDLKAIACVPLIAQEQTIGAIWIGRKTDIADGEVRLLTAIGDIAASAIYRSTLHEQTERHVHRLAALHAIDMTISSSLDLHVTLNVLLNQVTAQLHVDAAAVLLLNPHTYMLEYAADYGFRTRAIQQSRLRLGEGHAGRAALERCIISIPNVNEAECVRARAQLLQNERFVSHYIVPLLAKGQLKGVLEIFHRYPFTFDQEGLEFLEALAIQAAIAIDNAELFNNLQRSHTELTLAYDTTLEGWSHALELRDKETKGHTLRVTEMTLRLARSIGMNDADLVHIRRGALLHDIGKMGIPDSILLKPSPLADEEWEIMRRHPVYAYELLLPISFLRPALDIPYYHHEKWDGTGYLRRLKGEEIPLAARIFAVVDVWDSLCSDRPYRAGWPEEKVREHIRSMSGIYFDPKVVEVFLKMLEEMDREK